MGIIETVKELTRQEGIELGMMQGLEKGLEQGLEKGLEQGAERKSYIVVANLILKLGASDEQAAELAEVPVSFVRKVRAALNAKK